MAVAVNFPEVGYTPANLRHLIELLGETQAKVAEQLGVSPRVMRTWLAESDKPSHRDMPLHQWRKLLSLLETRQIIASCPKIKPPKRLHTLGGFG